MKKHDLIQRAEHLVFPIGALLTLLIYAVEPSVFSSTEFLLIFGFMIAVLGVPHGALDPWIAKSLGFQETARNRILFLLTYLATAALVVSVWIAAPATSLLVFLVISALHFSGDWKNKKMGGFHWLAGALLLLMPIGFQTESTAQIFQSISGAKGYELAYSLAVPEWLISCLIFVLIVGYGIHRKWRVVGEFFGLYFLAHYTPPLVYFAIYFCLLHSPRHLTEIFRKAGPSAYRSLFLMMLVFTLATFALAGILGWMWADLSTDALVLRLVFIGLAALTVPHMILITIAHQREARQRASADLPGL